MFPQSRSLLMTGVLSLACAACSQSHADVKAAAAKSGAAVADAPKSGAVVDSPLSASRNRLLELAFDSASALPLKPHIRNRAKSQEEVVTTCFELDQPHRALLYADKMPTWRQGAAYAEYAYYCAKHNATSEVQHYLDLAGKIADDVKGDDAQDWQRDRIRAKIAKTHVVLGQTKEAEEFEHGLVDSE